MLSSSTIVEDSVMSSEMFSLVMFSAMSSLVVVSTVLVMASVVLSVVSHYVSSSLLINVSISSVCCKSCIGFSGASSVGT